MPIFVIAAYHCEVAGQRTDSIDYQVRYFATEDADDVRSRLRAEKPHTYKNSHGKDVAWIFDEVISLEVSPRLIDGEEVIGFVATRPHVPEFGERDGNVEYVLRPGGYAIILNDEGQVALVSTPRGLFLPGGGQDAGESSDDAAIREAAEECGLKIKIGQCINVADELVFAAEYGGHFRKRCTFFLATVVGQAKATEADHELVWMSTQEAAKQLRHGSQRWTLGEAMAMIDRDNGPG